jgi:uncharacterized membrane protein
MNASRVLMLALLGLGGLYAAWFARSADWVAVWVFAAPPLLLAALAAVRPRAAAFWSGVLALGWFSHGVMVAWADPPLRAFALAAVALSLLVIGAANFEALRARRRGG